MPRFDVTIAGELNLDLILYGLPEQLLPERELLADRMMLTLGSSSAIVAHNLSALGSRVGFQSRIGDDPLGKIALERLQQGGVDVSQVRVVPAQTTTGLTVILHHESWRNILTYAGTIAELTLGRSRSRLSRRLAPLSFLVVLPAEGHCARESTELFQHLKSKGLTISLDTNDDPDDRWEGGLNEVLPLRRRIPAERTRGLQSRRDGGSGRCDPQAFRAGSAGRGEARPQRSAGADAELERFSQSLARSCPSGYGRRRRQLRRRISA